MIEINPSPTADTRTCDVTKVSKQQLLMSSVQHIADVGKGLAYFGGLLAERASIHDFDKLTDIDQFYADFQTKFDQTSWWDAHRRMHRHHLAKSDGVPLDVNLIDILEYITDCVMAGMARSGIVYALEMPDNVLRRAFENTVGLLQSNVVVVPASETWLDRLKAEHAQLCERHDKLAAFLTSGNTHSLPTIELESLQEQESVMASYRSILTTRLERATTAAAQG